MKLKKAGLITKIVVIVLVVYAAVRLINIHSDIEEAKDIQKELDQQVEEMETANAEMEYSLENSDDDEVIAGIARDKLGMAYPDEEIYTED